VQAIFCSQSTQQRFPRCIHCSARSVSVPTIHVKRPIFS